MKPRKNRKSTIPYEINVHLPEESKDKNSKNFIKYAKYFAGIIGFLIIVLKFYFDYKGNIKKEFQSTSQQNTDQIAKSGRLEPLVIDNKHTAENPAEFFINFRTKSAIKSDTSIKGIYIKDLQKKQYLDVQFLGKSHEIPVASFNNGYDILESICEYSRLRIKIINDSVYSSLTFKDLDDNRPFGHMDWNYWVIFNWDSTHFFSDSHKLQIRDKKERIVFSIEYLYDTKYKAVVKIAGYFISSKSVLVLLNDPKYIVSDRNYCFSKNDSNWKEKAEIEIDRIEPMQVKF